MLLRRVRRGTGRPRRPCARGAPWVRYDAHTDVPCDVPHRGAVGHNALIMSIGVDGLGLERKREGQHRAPAEAESDLRAAARPRRHAQQHRVPSGGGPGSGRGGGGVVPSVVSAKLVGRRPTPGGGHQQTGALGG